MVNKTKGKGNTLMVNMKSFESFEARPPLEAHRSRTRLRGASRPRFRNLAESIKTSESAKTTKADKTTSQAPSAHNERHKQTRKAVIGFKKHFRNLAKPEKKEKTEAGAGDNGDNAAESPGGNSVKVVATPIPEADGMMVESSGSRMMTREIRRSLALAMDNGQEVHPTLLAVQTEAVDG